MGSVSISSPNLQQILITFRGMPARIHESLQSTSGVIAGEMQRVVAQHYGSMAADWSFDVNTQGLASVHVFTDSEKVLWWEFGTRPHEIEPVNARVLRFTPRGAADPVFARRVHHPGTKPHNQRIYVAMALSQNAQFYWYEAINDALAGVPNSY